MRKLFLLAALLCMAALNVNAQTEENESKMEKMFRLTKTADENPSDWKAQLEAGHFLYDKRNGMNQLQAGKYYERLYHLATDYNKEIPDSVIQEAGMVLMTVASEKKDIDKTLFYVEGMEHAKMVGVDIKDQYLNMSDSWGALCNMAKENRAKALSYMMDFRERLAKNNTPGIENTDVLTAMMFEYLIETYRDMFGDKVIELTIDNKKCYVISMCDWNIEKPLTGWMVKSTENPLLVYSEDGKTDDEIHVNLLCTFKHGEGGVIPSENNNSRLVTVTPELRQKMVEAYRKYMKKAQTNKKH